MRDIIREGNHTLRAEAKPVKFPLSEADQKLARDMMEYLENSQDPELAKKYGLRAGVGLAAPQVDVSEQMAAVLVPSENEDDEPVFKAVIISHSVQPGALTEGEGCLSVDRDISGYVIRHDRITLRYYNMAGEQKKIRLKNYPAIVCQHEIDHLHGILFYDHINEANPFAADDDLVLIS